DVSIRQPLQEFAIAIGSVGTHRLGIASLPFGETRDHLFGRHRLLTHARRRRLDTDNHTVLVIHQIVVVVAETRRRAAFGGVSGIGIGGRYLILLVHRIFHRVLLFHFPQILTHGVVHLCSLRQLLARNPALFGGIRFHEAAIHRHMFAFDQPHFHTLPH